MAKKLVPPDRSRCQAEKSNGVGPFTLGGVQRMERCKNKPVVIATEKKAGADGQKGSMSLCAECRKVFEKQMGDIATFKRIEKLTYKVECSLGAGVTININGSDYSDGKVVIRGLSKKAAGALSKALNEGAATNVTFAHDLQQQ